MLADYVMKGIDNIFSEKMGSNPLQKTSKQFNSNNIRRSIFNKDVIKQSLHTIIRRDGNSKSPKSQCPSLSPISKSRLRVILDTEKDQRLKSVVKKVVAYEDASPYRVVNKGDAYDQYQDKENNVIKYYRNARKSMDKSQKGRKLQKSQVKKETPKNGQKRGLQRGLSRVQIKIDRF